MFRRHVLKFEHVFKYIILNLPGFTMKTPGFFFGCTSDSEVCSVKLEIGKVCFDKCFVVVFSCVFTSVRETTNCHPQWLAGPQCLSVVF